MRCASAFKADGLTERALPLLMTIGVSEDLRIASTAGAGGTEGDLDPTLFRPCDGGLPGRGRAHFHGHGPAAEPRLRIVGFRVRAFASNLEEPVAKLGHELRDTKQCGGTWPYRSVCWCSLTQRRPHLDAQPHVGPAAAGPTRKREEAVFGAPLPAATELLGEPMRRRRSTYRPRCPLAWIPHENPRADATRRRRAAEF